MTEAVTATTRPIAAPGLDDGEREFVEEVGRYYEHDGWPYPLGCIVGWLIISDPVQQPASEISSRLGVDRALVDRVADQLVPAKLLLSKELDDDDYELTLQDGAWTNAVSHTFTSWPSFHRIMADGLEALAAESTPERLGRLANMERLFAYMASELPFVIERYEASVAESS
jgi:hypothetical protein